MAKLSYDMLQQDTKQTFSNQQRVTFFSLKNDGDEAIVRFLCDDVADFEILSVHQVSIGGKFRKINCLRTPKDPIDACPLCATDNQLQQKFYVKLLQYVRDPETNEIVALPKIWEKSKAFATTLKGLIDEYGPLTDSIFKIKRQGEAGSRETTYTPYYCNPQVYKESLYPKAFDLFNGYKVLGGLVLDRSFEDVANFVETGTLPQVAKKPQDEKKTVGQVYPTATARQVAPQEEDFAPWEEPKTVIDTSKIERGGDLNSSWVKVTDTPHEEQKPKTVYNPQPVADKWEENLTTNPTTASKPEAVVERQVREEQPQQQSYRPVRRNYY